MLRHPIYDFNKTTNLDWQVLGCHASPNNIHIFEQFIEFCNPDAKHILWDGLSSSPHAIHILKNNIDKINWFYLASNEGAYDILKDNTDKITPEIYSNLYKNKNAIPIIKTIPINNFRTCSIVYNENALEIIKNDWWVKGHPGFWSALSENPGAIELLQNKLDQVNWQHLSSNLKAISILEENLDKVDWFYLSSNPNAIHILQDNIDKINWGQLLRNPNAINLIELLFDTFCHTEQKICYYVGHHLVRNQSALHLILKYYDYIKDCQKIYLSYNSHALHLLFSLDYEKMKERNTLFAEELIEYVLHPERLVNISTVYNIPFIELLEMY